LRAHRAHQVSEQDLALAGAARELSFGDFLRAALEINPAAVDNTYLRAFGARLPSRRWEQRAEPEACQSLKELNFSFDELMRRATAFLDNMSAVGILEDFERSLGTIFSRLGLSRPPHYEHKQRLVDLIASDPNFEPVDAVEITREDEHLVADLTRFDRQLYEECRRSLARNSKAKQPAAQGFASDVLPIIHQIEANGVTGPRAVAAALNARGIPTVRGGTWDAATVRSLLALS
jgi:hypothetical protein